MNEPCAYGERPKLRGVSHLLTFYLGLAGAIALLAFTPPGPVRLVVTIYVVCFLTLFGVSSTFHRRRWTERGHDRMRRLDHASIYLMISGTCTPVAWLGLPAPDNVHLITIIWIGALLGVLQAFFWMDVPRTVRAAFYLALGWVAIGEWPAFHETFGADGMWLLAGGGAIYSLGGLVYATRWPDPKPDVFGFHEVFHLCVVAGALCHAALVVTLVV